VLQLLRWLQLLSMALWVGGLAFFAFVLAPTAFRVLPSFHEAGLIVGEALKVFDTISLAGGAVFLAATAILFLRAPNRIKGRYEMEFLLALVMVVCTVYLTWNVIPAMDQDQVLAGGDVNTVPPTNPARIHFEKLHKRSENVAGTVFFIGLGVLFLMSREHVVLPPLEKTPVT
jgi:uncharacterized membrane protein